MPKQVISTAMLVCSMGLSPSSLIVLPVRTVLDDNHPAANITDHVPVTNIVPFGMCKSPTNPAVAMATAAAFGVLTPIPCLPVTPAPWSPGSSTVLIDSQPALNHNSTCACVWGGVIKITKPGQLKMDIP
jgi:hypothetical protein